MKKPRDKKKIRIVDLLKSEPEGLTIQGVMDKTGLARHTVLARLHALVGAKKVEVKQINMAKVHRWIKEPETKEEKRGAEEHPHKKKVKVRPLEEEHITKKRRSPKEKEAHAEAERKSNLDMKKIKEDIEQELRTGKIQKHHAKIKEQRASISHKAKKLKSKRVELAENGEATSEEHTQEPAQGEPPKKEGKLDMKKIKEGIEQELQTGKKQEHPEKSQQDSATHYVDNSRHKGKKGDNRYIKTGIPGLDDLFEKGIPVGSSVLIAGGAGSGKTILSLQTLYHHALHGEKCLYMSFEESEERLIHHMEDFGWDPQPLIKKGDLLIKRFNPFDITRNVDALLMQAKGELLIDIEPVIFPNNFKPDIIVVDSLTAIASAFTGREDSYRIYIEQLFRFFEKIDATSFLLTETKQIPTIFSQSGVEEFLADGVIVLYAIKRGNVRENAIEVLKLRGAKHKKQIVAMQITDAGMVVYPEQEVFDEVQTEKE